MPGNENYVKHNSHHQRAQSTRRNEHGNNGNTERRLLYNIAVSIRSVSRTRGIFFGQGWQGCKGNLYRKKHNWPEGSASVREGIPERINY